MNITTTSLGETIPVKHTCDGENVNPELAFEDIPEETKSLSLIVDDPDAPGGLFTHWIVFNIDPKTQKIQENTPPATGVIGKNDFKNIDYDGPCPPSGTHRYYFRLFALDTMLDLKEGCNRAQLDSAIENHVIESAELMSRYGSDAELEEQLGNQDLDDYTDDRDTSDGQLISS